MQLFQFWHDDPPDDVLQMMEATRLGQRDFDYVRLDDRSGRSFIAERYGARELAAWDACILPAMRSDMLRLLLMEVHGGIYADATFFFPGNLSDLIAITPVALMPMWVRLVINNFLVFRQPRHPFIRACISLLMENIEERRFGSALIATGPAVLNSVRSAISSDEAPEIMYLASTNDDWMRWGWMESVAAAKRLIKPEPSLVSAYQAISLVPVEILQKYARNQLHASHRGEKHWLRWSGSIYR